jgi:hypothetical protein
MAEEVNPDVLAQMKRIWSAVNDGTLDKDTVNDALRLMHDFLTGAAYDDASPDTAGEEAVAEVAEPAGEEAPHPRKKPRKKR